MKKSAILVIALCLMFFCGCTGYKEIDRGYIVTAIGFEEQDGTVGIFIEAISSSDVSDEKSKRIVLSSNGTDEIKAYENLKNTLVKPLYFEQLGTIIFDKKAIPNTDFLKQITNINMGIYVVKSDNVKALFESETPNGVLGYDVITLIKTQEKQNGEITKNKFYKAQKADLECAVVNSVNGHLILN